MIKAALYFMFSVMVLGCLFVFAFWTALPHFAGDVCFELEKRQTPVRTYRDHSGEVILLEPTHDWQYRLDVPLEEVAEDAVRVMLAVEDRNFLWHDGVDRLAALRSLWMNIRHRGVMSGASTVTMQLAGVTLRRSRSWGWKFRQAGAARKLEWLHGKKWILQNYMNRIPFGGNIYGIEAAGRFYFGRHAATLNMAEATLLCGLPQRPNAFRPDRHPERARERQKMVLLLLERNGVVTHEEARRIFEQEPLRYRDFGNPSPLKSHYYQRNDHYLRVARREAKNGLDVHCALEPGKQTLLLEALRSQAATLPGVEDGAGVIMDNATGKVLAMVGTLDYASQHGGQVNAAFARRTAGSTLKPFIFAEAIDGGLLCAETILYDTPLRYGTYTPGNYDGTYQDGVTAADALSQSLNTPAIRLVARLGTERVLGMFARLGLLKQDIWSDNQELARTLGLSMALGTGGYRLVDIAAAYSALANGGMLRPPTFLENGAAGSPMQVFTPGGAAVVLSMLSKRKLPGCELEVAWKTGTSSGNHDAWCFAVTRDVTVGIWFGNKDGRPSSSLVGASAAAPTAAAVLNALYRDSLPTPFELDSCLAKVTLCARSGLRAVPGLCKEKTGYAAKGIPLRECRTCAKGRIERVNIVRPMPQTYHARRNGVAQIQVQTDPAEAHWYVNESYQGMLKTGDILTLGPGSYLLRAVSEEEGIRPGTVKVEVRLRDAGGRR